MMQARQSIRFIGRYGTYRAGDIIRPPASLRKILLDRKVAELVIEPAITEKPVSAPKAKRKKK